jgi:hypothetical protein
LLLCEDDRLDRELMRHINYVVPYLLPQVWDWFVEGKEFDKKRAFRFTWRFMLVLKVYLRKKRGWKISEIKKLMEETYNVFKGR